MRLRSRNYAASTLLALLAVSPLANGQVLIKRHPEHKDCPDTNLRLTARHPDGSPAALRKQDVYLWFAVGSADIRSMESGAPKQAGPLGKIITPDTDVLIVVPPRATVDGSAVDAVLRSLRAAADFHWKTAVLAPDGSISPFANGADEATLHPALVHAIAPNPAARSIADWTAAEHNAFRQLHARSGRHVIVELAPPASEISKGETNQDAFAQDRTLDLLARDDVAQIYRLAAPGAKEQIEATGGRTAPTIDALFHDIVSDAPGSYDLLVHPLFSCEPGSSYSLRITSFQPETQLFYPSALRMATAPPHSP